MKTYTFEVVCQDGQTRNFEFQAENFGQARSMLKQLRESPPSPAPAPIVEPTPYAGTTNVRHVVRSSGSVSYF